MIFYSIIICIGLGLTLSMSGLDLRVVCPWHWPLTCSHWVRLW